VSNQTQSSVEQYTLSSGVPTGGQAAAVTDSGPSFITVDPTGQFVYVAASATGTAGFIDAFTIHAGGLLSNVASVQAGQSQKWIAIDPSGRFAYTADPLSNLIWEFTINDSTGQLTANSTPSMSVGAAGAIPGSNTVVIEPSGKFAYAANQSLNQIFGFSISSSTGLLTPLNSGSALASTGTDPVALGVDISGQFLYCTNQGSNDISIFSINPSTGALTQVGTGTVQAGDTQPYGFALTGTRQ